MISTDQERLAQLIVSHMPNVAAVLEEQRQAFGAAHVDDCIVRGLDGQPGFFYAIEGGHVVGTPFFGDATLLQALALQILFGRSFTVVIRPPSEVEAPRAVH